MSTAALTDGRHERAAVRGKAWLPGRDVGPVPLIHTWPLSSESTPFALCRDTAAGTCVLSPRAGGWLLGFVSRSSGGALGGHNRARSLPSWSYCAVSSTAASRSVAWECPLQWPSQTSPPSLNFSTTGWAPPMEQPRSTPSSGCSDYPGGHSYTTAPNPTSFTATRQATPTGHAFHHTSSALGKPIPLSLAGGKHTAESSAPSLLTTPPPSCFVRLLLLNL